MANQRLLIVRGRQAGLALLLAVLMVAASLALLLLNVQARFNASGEGGCGDFSTAVDLAEDGDTIGVMLSERNSDGKTITKNVLIHGGWLPPPGGCSGQQVYSETAGFEFHGPISRSILSHYAGPSVITIDPSVITLTIQNMAFLNNGGTTTRGAGISGVISNGARVRLDNVVISESEVTDAGGGLHLEVRGGSRLVIAGSQFISNTSGNTGGGLEIDVYDGSEVIIENTQVLSNTANSGDGGGARIRIIDSGYVTVTHSSFAGNQAPAGAGAELWVEGLGSGPAEVWLIGTTFNGASASGNPGVHVGGAGLTAFILDKLTFLPLALKNHPPGTPVAQINNITIDGSDYVVDFQTTNFTPQLPGQHVHFFFDTVPPGQAGVPGAGKWFVYGGSSPFRGYKVVDRPVAATQMCILVANPDHTVQPGTGNCFKLP